MGITNEEFRAAVLTTESAPDRLEGRLSDIRTRRILHAAMGLCTEGGEIMDQVKKHVFYGSELDTVNLIEEGGDVLWYLTVLFDTLNISMADVMEINRRKLLARYGGKFSSDAAIHRDTDKERRALEGEGD
jgi:NTP pyrophosphatase (non-canonical NTP hydrolase)